MRTNRYLSNILLSLVTLSAFSLTGCIGAEEEENTAKSSAAISSKNILVTMSMPVTQLKTTDSVLVSFTVTNQSAIEQSVERWLLPTQKISADILAVSIDGQRLPYSGPFVKRGADDYVVLAPGQSITATIDISAAYDVTAAGQYTVEFVGLPMSVAAKQAPVSFAILETRTTATAIAPKVECTVDQTAKLSTALANAKIIANRARDVLATTSVANRTTAARYSQWFGAYDSSRYQTIQNHFTSLATATPLVAFSCDCDPSLANAYAYVYPSSPYTITLCNAFWSAPVLGTDSQAGTIIHETSHFSVVTGTQDYVYGQSNAVNLAVNTPNQAIMNADSHEYFAENTPFLTMTRQAVVFFNGDTRRSTDSDWDANYWKGDCAANEAISGISVSPAGDFTHAGLCTNLDVSGSYVTTLSADGSDRRRASRNGDWDAGNYKLECGEGEYVNGFSQSPSSPASFHGVRCSRGVGSVNGCSAVEVGAGDHGVTSPDWDANYYKTECGAGKVVVGVSQSTSSGQIHRILCCNQ